MKVTIEETPGAEPELIVRCASADDPQVQTLLALAAGLGRRIPVRLDGEVAFWDPQTVLYCEFVDRTVFAYTADAVRPTPLTLARLEQDFPGFLRCSKSMVVNLRGICRLRSEVGGRITAALCNGECILISRHYAAALRQALRTGKESLQ